MSNLKLGTFCVVIAGCPENIGLVMEVTENLGRHGLRSDAYRVRTVSGRLFQQLWHGNKLRLGTSNKCITDRHKLRPLVDSKDKGEDEQVHAPAPIGVLA